MVPAVLLLTLLVAPPCPAPREFRAQAMGSEAVVVLCARPRTKPEQEAEAVFAELRRLEALWSTWLPASDLSRLNAAAPAEVAVAPETAALLAKALQFGEASGGLFDVTFASLGLWHFDHDGDGQVPGDEAIAAALPRVGFRHLHVELKRSRARIDQRGTVVNVGGLGKGAAVDAAVALLKRRGHTAFVVKLGGDLRAVGEPMAGGWSVGLHDPRGGPDDLFARMQVRDAALSTSADDQRAFVKDGVRYHHLIDPRTGHPGRASRSVTVLAPDATTAEWLTKALFLLGPAEGLALAAKAKVEAVWVGPKGEVVLTPGLQERLEPLHAPLGGE